MAQSQEQAQSGKYNIHKVTWSKMTDEERAKAQWAINQRGWRTDTVNKIMDYMANKYGVSSESIASDTATGTEGGLASYTDNFENTWSAFEQAQQDAYGIETQRGEEKIKLEQENLNRTRTAEQLTADYKASQLQEQMERAKQDYSKFVSRINDETTRTLIQNSKSFATKLSSATSAYGQRGIMRSGLASIQTKEGTSEYADDQAYYKIGQQQKIDDESAKLSRMGKDYTATKEYTDKFWGLTEEQYNANKKALETKSSQWSSDRGVGSDILWMQLQSDGDTLYNSTVTAQMEATRKQAEQDAINNLYGIKTTGTRVPYRLWGQYIS